VYRAQLTRAACLGAVALAASCTRLPEGWLYVTAVTPSSATVVWTVAHIDELDCKPSAAVAAQPVVVARRSGLSYARIDGLTAGTAYTCFLVDTDQRRRRKIRFRTAPTSADPFTFAVVGDSGDRSRAAARLAQRILEMRPDFLLHLGDLAYRKGTPAQFNARFFKPYRRVLERVPVFPTPGNHDLTSASCYPEVFESVPGMNAGPYAFDWGTSRFFSVDFRAFKKAGVGPHWLDGELAAARDRRWRIAFTHTPLQTSARKGSVIGVRRRVLWRTLETGRADLALSGHAHLYERTETACRYDAAARLLSIVSGGGGDETLDQPQPHPSVPRSVAAPHVLRVRVSTEEIEVWAVGVDGRILDHVRHRGDAATPCRRHDWVAHGGT
jgi:hypothetical protein